MTAPRQEDFPASVIGAVRGEKDATIDQAEKAGLENTVRLNSAAAFIGTVISPEVFAAVEAVDGVSSLEIVRPVGTAE